jgi:hypothetical protein
VVSGAIGTSSPEVAPSSTSASGTTPSIATASGIAAPSTCASVITKHATSVLGGYDYYTGQTTSSSLCTFHYGDFWWRSLCALRNDLNLRKGCGFLNSWRRVFFTSYCTRFLAFQDRSVDFLHNTNSVISQARLPTYMYYSKIDFTHKLDRATVTVGVPRMLVLSTSPASAGGSSSTWATTGSMVPVVAEGSGLLSSDDARGLPTSVAC